MSTVAYRNRLSDLNTYEPRGMSREASVNLSMKIEIYKHLCEVLSREDLSVEFYELAMNWKKETRFSSSVLEICTNHSYQQIIGMGEKALPFIFEELKKGPGHWFWALKAITRIDPVDPGDRGNLNKMTRAWLLWWDENSYKF